MHIVADSDEEIAAIGDRLPELVARRQVEEMAAVIIVRVIVKVLYGCHHWAKVLRCV